MKFVDIAKIFVASGNGGNGIVSFRRESGVPMGGPDGGSGGNGGNIVVQVVDDIETLCDFLYQTNYKAQHGQNGGSSNCSGKYGKDLILKVPKGTEIYDENREILIYEALEVGEKFVLFPGGKGGAGNAKFANSVNQSPINATKGEKGQEAYIFLVLKLFCDYGFVGLPNAGKSSLLNVLTASKSKVGNYPFTTLNPKLGTLWKNEKKVLFADLPGLIQGASENKGLGFRFLGHVERCKGIVHVLDASSTNCAENLQIIINELALFHEDLAKKPAIVVLNKIDLILESELQILIENLKSKYNFNIFPVSALNKTGLQEFVDFICSQ